MRDTTPNVRLIAAPKIELNTLAQYLHEVGGSRWMEKAEQQASPDAEDLIEFAGRMCYRSYEPGLNPNVSRIREDSGVYLANIVASQHGSVLEHANFTFVFSDVSRVFTHELVRHRAGSAYSQESLRYVRLDDIPFWFPEWAKEDPELMERSLALLEQMEAHQQWMSEHFGLDEEGVRFSEKKHKTSFMRRFAPEGLSTAIVWTANVRAIRHVVEMRTAEGAEEEMRLVFGKVAELVSAEVPALFADYEVVNGAWVPGTRKV